VSAASFWFAKRNITRAQASEDTASNQEEVVAGKRAVCGRPAQADKIGDLRVAGGALALQRVAWQLKN